MSDPEYLKGSCQQCGEHLEFPAGAVGEPIQCPHCGEQTQLEADAGTVPGPSGPKVRIIAGAVLICLMLAGAAMVFYAGKLRKAPAPTASPTTATATNPVVAAGTSGLNDFQISPITLKKAENGGLVHAVGTVKNVTDRQRFGVKITLDVLDAHDEKIGQASDYAAILEPHQAWLFRALLTEPQAITAKPAKIEEQQ